MESGLSMTWKTIDSAPRDGTEVLLYEKLQYELPYRFVGKFDSGEWLCTEYDAFNHNPSHWMELPPTPLSVTSVQEGEK